ncbi:hypothetical protein BH10PSE3_BH10PSE3_03410 [soil metagenome]
MAISPAEATDAALPGPPRRGRPPRTAAPAPTRAEVVAAVVKLAQTHRDADINMRDLAQALNVSPKLLYRYVASKDELLDLAAAALLETWVAPSDALPWSDRLTAVIGGARDLIERFPALSRAVLMRNLQARDSPEVSRVVASIKGCFADAGLSASEVDQVFLAYETLILGELALSRAVRDGELPEANLPDASARAAALEATLRLMMIGIAALHAAGPPRRT